MIFDLIPQLNKLRIVLASGSPRRRELLERLGLRFDVLVSDFAEDLDKASFPDARAYNLATARGKLDDVLSTLRATQQEADIVITCDTIVVPCDAPSVIIEKAASKEDAIRMITDLAGTSHFVYSALVVHFCREQRTVERVVQTVVTMASLTPAVIAAYVEHDSAWQGKSGAYGIQDVASSFIEAINGDFYNVVGFPLCEFCKVVREVVGAHPELLDAKVVQ